MSLEALLKPFKVTDEVLLRQYTRFSLWLEEKHVPQKTHSLYPLAGVAVGLLGMIVLPGNFQMEINPAEPLEALIAYPAAAFTAYGLPSLFIHDGLYTLHNLSSQDSTSSVVAEDRFAYASRKIQRAFRLPLLITGGYLSYKGITPMIANDTSEGLKATASILVIDIGLASSMYLKDTKPRLLDKEPAWKRAYHWLSEKVQGMVHRPASSPVPNRYDSIT